MTSQMMPDVALPGQDGVAGAEPGPERGEQGLGQDAQDDVEVDVEVDSGGQGVGAECADDLGEALPGGHAAAYWLISALVVMRCRW